MMVSPRDDVAQEAFLEESIDVLPLLHLLSGKSVTVGRKVTFRVWSVEPACHIGSDVNVLDIYGSRDAKSGSVSDATPYLG